MQGILILFWLGGRCAYRVKEGGSGSFLPLEPFAKASAEPRGEIGGGFFSDSEAARDFLCGVALDEMVRNCLAAPI